MSASSTNPNGAFNFLVTIDGVPVAAFAECVLPTVSIDIMDYRQGFDDTQNVRKIPGLVSYGNMILRHGIASGPTLLAIWDWFSTVMKGTGQSKVVTVTLLNAERNPVLVWSFTGAWPVKYESPVLNAKTSTIAIESIELAVEGLTVSTSGG